MSRVKAENLQTGKHYKIIHSRKGEAIVQCKEVYDGTGTFTVVEGELRGINDYYGPGDEITVRNDLATFYEHP